MCVSEIWHAWKCFPLLSQELQFDELPAPSHVLRRWYTAMLNVFIQNWPFERPDKHENKDRIGSLIFKCNLKTFCCSTFVMKDMYGKSKEDVLWESHFPLLGIGFQRINKAAFRVFCIMSSSSRLLAHQDKLDCQSWKSHIWFLFSSEKGNSPNTLNNT